MLRALLTRPTFRTFGLVVGYVLCFWSIRLIILTLIAYTVVKAPDQAVSALQRIGDVARANQIVTYGIAALVFTVLLHGLHPLTRTTFKDIFDFKKLKECFSANALNGLILAIVLIAGSMLGGHMSYLGVYVKFDEVVLALFSAAIFGGGLFALVLVEEYILRAVLEPKLSEQWGPIGASMTSCAIYLFFKATQFDMTWVSAINFILLNLTFSMIAQNERTCFASASFGGTFMVLVHVLFGLPFMGQDMPGIFLLRGASDEGLGSLLSGGAIGPEGGLVLTVLLLIYLYLPQIRSKKIEA